MRTEDTQLFTRREGPSHSRCPGTLRIRCTPGPPGSNVAVSLQFANSEMLQLAQSSPFYMNVFTICWKTLLDQPHCHLNTKLSSQDPCPFSSLCPSASTHRHRFTFKSLSHIIIIYSIFQNYLQKIAHTFNSQERNVILLKKKSYIKP